MVGQKGNSATKNWAIAGIIISWGTFWMFLFSPFGFVAWIGILIYLIIKNSRLKWYVIFSAWVFVPSLSFLNATVRYFTGTTSMQGVGGPETYHGIDRETRVKSTSSGCIFVGFEAFVFPANNAAVRLWTNVFGYQKGAYSGVYPTEEEAKEIVNLADTIDVKRHDNYFEFATGGANVQLDTMEFCRYRHCVGLFDKVVGRTLNNECFIFRELDSNGEERIVYIADIEHKQILNRYYGDY